MIRGLILGLLLTAIAFPAQAQDTQEKRSGDLTEREKAFQDTMTDAVLVGTFRMLNENGLSDSHDEAYTIAGVKKIHGENWIVESRIQYMEKDITVPIPIKLYWIEDTPVISVTDLLIPGAGTYTSRVQVYRGCYAGTWFGKGYGGTLSGRIWPRAEWEKMKQRIAGDKD